MPFLACPGKLQESNSLATDDQQIRAGTILFAIEWHFGPASLTNAAFCY
jgi:hypothetical protein